MIACQVRVALPAFEAALLAARPEGEKTMIIGAKRSRGQQLIWRRIEGRRT